MKLRYEPGARLADRLLEEKTVERLWARDPTVWGAAPGSAEERSILTRLGWLDIESTMPPHLEALKALLATYSTRGGFDDAPKAGPALVTEVRNAIASLKPGDYVAFLSYLPADEHSRRRSLQSETS